MQSEAWGAVICILIYWCLIFFTCARWAPPLIQQAEHWRLCKSHLVFGFLEEVKTNVICPEFKGAVLFVILQLHCRFQICVFCVPKAHRKGPLGLLKVRVADDEWHSSVAEGSSPAWMASDHHCFWYYDMRQTLGSGFLAVIGDCVSQRPYLLMSIIKCWY